MIRNVGLSSALNLYCALIQFALNMALARFLAPKEFGEVALVLPATLFILLIGDFGLSGAIVRRSADPESAGDTAMLALRRAPLIAALATLRAAGVRAAG